RGKPWLLEGHLQRLARSLESIRIRGIDIPRLRRRIMETIAAGPFAEAMVYIQITRGAAPRQHKFPQGVIPYELLYVQEFNDPYVELRKAGCAVITQPDHRWDRCDIKPTNLLAKV